MRQARRFYAIAIWTVFAGLFSSCAKQDSTTSAPQPQETAASVSLGGWQPAMLTKFAGLVVRDGGGCYLDAVNGDPITASPIRVKGGSPTSLAGWAVADLKAGRLGTSLGLQLNATTPYFIAADAYQRPGLGAALKHPALDGGGLKLDATPLNIPVGDYRILVLIQSDGDLLRCDTGHTIRVE